MLKADGYALSRLEIGESPQRMLEFTEESFSDERQKRLDAAVERLSAEEFAKHTAQADIKPEKTALKAVSNGLKATEAVVIESSAPASKTWFAAAVLLVILGGFAVMQIVRLWGMYPLGLDIHGHLFKSDLMYEEISKGNLYPIFTQYWYNGLQPFRYWPPMPYYVMAGLQFLAGGSVIEAYLAFIWFSFSVGGIGWLLLAKRLNRPWLGLFAAFLWFFLPDNLRVFFGEGNLPRMFITVLIPFILYFLWEFVEYKRKKMIIPLIIFMAIAVLGHLMISAMIGVGCFVFLLIHSIITKEWKPSAFALAAMLFSFAVMGIWVYPALVGGLTSMASEGTEGIMTSLSEPLTVSLNPAVRIGNIGRLYFGLSVAVISVIGLVAAGKKSRSGFASMLIVIAGTTTALTPLIAKIPFSELFWVRRFAPIAYGMFVIALLEWKQLKKPILAIMCVAVAVDCIPSFNLAEFDTSMNIPATQSAISGTMDEYLFTEAKEITAQRVSLMDLSTLGPMPSYAFGTLGEKTPYVFGWAWQGAATANNIAYINESLEKKNYLYMFDRHVELGADTVLINKGQVLENDRPALIQAAKQSGYRLADEGEHTMLFTLDMDGNFGVISKYSGLAIGTTAALVPGELPFYRPGDKLTIDEYTVDELAQYDMIYLSGFFYDSKDKAEEIVRETAARGVKVYIDMSRIPSDPVTNRMSFLGVAAQPISFDVKFPDIISGDDTVYPSPFADGYEHWNTVYLTNLTETGGYAWFQSNRLDVFGRGEDENITFIGFNLLFHAYTAYDSGVHDLLNGIMALDEDALPKRETVPLEITYDTNKITIKSNYDDVNTTIAYQDTFESDSPIRSVNNLLVVDKGTTVITMHYPYLAKGLIITFSGVFAEGVLLYFLFRKRRFKNEKP